MDLSIIDKVVNEVLEEVLKERNKNMQVSQVNQGTLGNNKFEGGLLIKSLLLPWSIP